MKHLALEPIIYSASPSDVFSWNASADSVRLCDLVTVRAFADFTGAKTVLLSGSIVLWSLSLVCRQAGQGTASDTFINSHTNAGIPARFFAFCCFPLHGILDTSPLLRIPQIPFLTLDCTMCSLFYLCFYECSWVSKLSGFLWVLWDAEQKASNSPMTEILTFMIQIWGKNTRIWVLISKTFYSQRRHLHSAALLQLWHFYRIVGL